jgi:hypothetical protein
MEHYHCHNVYIPAPKGTCVCSSVFIEYKYLTMPTLTPSDVLIKVADTVSEAITGAIPVSSVTNDAITQLLNIFKQQANSTKQDISSKGANTASTISKGAQRTIKHIPQPELPTQADELWMNLIESQPEFQSLKIEEQIPEPENLIRTSRISQELVHNHSTPASNTCQQHRIQTVT